MEMIQSWDTLIAQQTYVVNGTSTRWGLEIIASNPLFKGIPILCLLIAAWFSKNADLNTRSNVMATIITGMLAVLVGRILALSLPFRLRPIYDAILVLEPSGVAKDAFAEWSSFPSDHSVVYFALAIGLFQISRWLGAIAIFHAAVIICVPRVLLGLHFASDLIAGALVGGLFTLLIWRHIAKAISLTSIGTWPDKWPQLAYPALFIIAFQLSTMFDSLRELILFAFISMR